MPAVTDVAAAYTSLVFWLKTGVLGLAAVGILIAGMTSREVSPGPTRRVAPVASESPMRTDRGGVVGPPESSPSTGDHGAPSTVASVVVPAPLASSVAVAPGEGAVAMRGQGALDITAMRSDAVLIDRVEAGKGPHLFVVLPAGSHEVRARRAEGEVPVQIEVVAGRRAKLDLRPSRRSR